MFSAKNKNFTDLQTLPKCIRLYGGQNISRENFLLIQAFAFEFGDFAIEFVQLNSSHLQLSSLLLQLNSVCN